jgi:hypothetical protein
MDNQPHALTKSEIKEIAEMPDIRQMWGAIDEAEMQETLESSVYAVRFDYVSGSPGYCGDYFILQGDALIGEPLQLIRDGDRRLKII